MIRLIDDSYTNELVAKLDNLPAEADVGDVLDLNGELWQITDIDDRKSGAWVYASKVSRFEVNAVSDEPWRGEERREE